MIGQRLYAHQVAAFVASLAPQQISVGLTSYFRRSNKQIKGNKIDFFFRFFLLFRGLYLVVLGLFWMGSSCCRWNQPTARHIFIDLNKSPPNYAYVVLFGGGFSVCRGMFGL